MKQEKNIDEIYLKVRARVGETVSRAYGYGKCGQTREATVEESKCVRDVMGIFKKSFGQEEEVVRKPKRRVKRLRRESAEVDSGSAG